MKIFETREDMLRHICYYNEHLNMTGSILEIGVFKGDFAKFLRKICHRLYLCDPWDGVSVSGDADGNNVIAADLPEELEKLRAYFKQRWRRGNRVHFIRGRSPSALHFLPDQSMDVIYIDGDHSFTGCLRDLQEAKRLVRPGGWICGHDYEMNPEKTAARYDFGVKQAVQAFCAEHGLEVSALGMDGCVSYGIQMPEH